MPKAAFISRAKKDIKEYANQCSIVNGALQFLNDNAQPEELEEDWIDQFFDKARLVSNKEFQIIWSRLLAEECNVPGTVPKGLIFILEKMDKEDAECFLQFCGTVIYVFGSTSPLIVNINNEGLNKLGLCFDTLVYLESLGLIKISPGLFSSSYFVTADETDDKLITYFDNQYVLPNTMTRFQVGNVIFTKDGEALYKAVNAKEIEGFWVDTVLPWIKNQVQ